MNDPIELIKQAQQIFKDAGMYPWAIDGIPGNGTLTAAKTWMAQHPNPNPETPANFIIFPDVYHGDDNFNNVLKYPACILKLTEGSGYIDPSYAERSKLLQENNILQGAYHFSDGSNPMDQANHFVATLRKMGWTPKVKVGLDWEPSSHGNDMSLTSALIFVNEVKKALGISKVFIYASNFLTEALSQTGNENLFQNEDIWIASYRNTTPVLPNNRQFKYWQYTGTGLDQGLDFNDMNKFFGTLDELKATWANV